MKGRKINLSRDERVSNPGEAMTAADLGPIIRPLARRTQYPLLSGCPENAGDVPAPAEFTFAWN